MKKKIIIPEKVKRMMAVFEKNGGEIYLVGGAVRDLLSEGTVKDWDFATNLIPEKMKRLFAKNSFCNNRFGTLSIVGKNKEIFEVTTYRKEVGYSDKRHPDKIIWGKRLEDDLARRDFTINALALDSQGEKVIDLYGGREDLAKKLIRAVGSADKRFGEDALRMMRAVRIATTLGFTIEKKTFEAMVKNASSIRQVAGERISHELFLILLSPTPAEGIKLLRNCGLLAEIMPELLAGIGIEQKGHHIDDVWTHNLKTLANCQSRNPVTRLACLLHDVDKAVVVKGEGENRTFHNHEVSGARTAVRIGKRLRLSNKQLDLLFRLVRWHMFTASEKQTDKAIRRLIRNVTVEYIGEMIAMRRADRVGSGARESSWRWELFKKRIVEVQKQPFSIKDLKVNGKDVMKVLKIRPGRKVGKVLESLFAEVEEDVKLNKREILLKKLEQISSLSS